MQIGKIEKEITEKMPEFIEAMHMVEHHGADIVLTNILSFSTPDLLYKALRLCAARGIVVQFMASKDHPLLLHSNKAD